MELYLNSHHIEFLSHHWYTVLFAYYYNNFFIPTEVHLTLANPLPPTLPSPSVLFNWQQRELVSGLTAKLLRFPELMSPPNLSFRGSTISQILYICETIPLVRARAGAPAHSNVARDTTIDRARGGERRTLFKVGDTPPPPPHPTPLVVNINQPYISANRKL